MSFRIKPLCRLAFLLVVYVVFVATPGCEKAEQADDGPSAVLSSNEDRERNDSLTNSSSSMLEPRAKKISWSVAKGDPRRVELVEQIARLDEAIEKDPEMADTYLKRGREELNLREYCMLADRHTLHMWATEDFNRAHELAGGDPLVDPDSGRVLSLDEVNALEVDRDGRLLKIPNVHRIGADRYVRIDEAGAETRVGGPGSAEALVGICRVLQKQYREEEAAEVERRAELVDPNDFDLQVYKGMMIGNLGGEWLDAAKKLEALASQAEGEKQLLAKTHQGLSLAAAGELEDAEKLFREVLAVDEKYDPARMYLGSLLIGMDRVEESKEYLSSFVEVQDSDLLRANDMALRLNDNGKPAEAVALLRRVVEMSPGFPAAWNNLGVVYHDMGKLDEAIEAYRNAIKALPIYLDAYTNLGSTLADAKRYREAEVVYFTLMQLNPDHALVYYNMGNNYADMGKYEKAAEYYRKYTERAPDDPRGWSNLGWVSRKLDSEAESEVAYLRALAVDGKHASALNGLGAILQDRGKGKHAFDYYARACDIAPTSSLYIGNLNRVARQNAMYEQLIEKLSELMGRDGVSPQLWLLRANAHCMIDRFDEAIKDCDHGVDNAPSAWKVNFLFTRAMSNMLKGDDRAAIRDIEAVTSIRETYGYPALWAWGIHMRNGDPAAAKATVEQALDKVDSKEYMASLLGYLLGKIDGPALIGAAETGDQKCEAYYYIGVKEDIEGRADSAVEWFKKSVGTRLADNYEYCLAYHELKSRGNIATK